MRASQVGITTNGSSGRIDGTSVLSGEELNWSVYPIETIIAEKLHALVSHGDQNSRSKDVHDLAVFLPKADAKVLKEAVMALVAKLDLKNDGQE